MKYILLVVGAIFAFWAIDLFKYVICSAKKRKELYDSLDEESCDEAEIMTVRAEVVDMACRIETVGTKLPKVVKEFVVSFKTETDEVLHLHVAEEFYNDYEIGMSGILTIIDGALNSFELD